MLRVIIRARGTANEIAPAKRRSGDLRRPKSIARHKPTTRFLIVPQHRQLQAAPGCGATTYRPFLAGGGRVGDRDLFGWAEGGRDCESAEEESTDNGDPLIRLLRDERPPVRHDVEGFHDESRAIDGFTDQESFSISSDVVRIKHRVSTGLGLEQRPC